jgi:hypothetical protein
MRDLRHGDLAIGSDHLLRNLIGKMVAVLRLPVSDLLLHDWVLDVDQDNSLRVVGVVGRPRGKHAFADIPGSNGGPGWNATSDT